MIEKILIRAPEELKIQLKQKSEEKGSTMNQLILQILWDWADKTTNQKLKI